MSTGENIMRFKDREISEQRAREQIQRRIEDDMRKAAAEAGVKLEEEGDDLPVNPSAAGDEEPTIEQLKATGEYQDDEDPPGSGEGGEGNEGDGNGGNEPPQPTAVALREQRAEQKAEDKSIQKQVHDALLEGASQEELIDGSYNGVSYNKRTVQTVASFVKKELKTRTSPGKAPLTGKNGLAIFAKGSPPEAIIEAIEVPDMGSDGGEAFEKGLKFGMSLSVYGVRMAQELSAMGIVQAKPIIDMAKQMREGEVQAAKGAAGEAAMQAANIVTENLVPVLEQMAKNKPAAQPAPIYAASKNPMQDMMMNTMMPIMQKLLAGALGGLAGGAALPGGPATPQLPVGTTPTNVNGWVRRTE